MQGGQIRTFAATGIQHLARLNFHQGKAFMHAPRDFAPQEIRIRDVVRIGKQRANAADVDRCALLGAGSGSMGHGVLR